MQYFNTLPLITQKDFSGNLITVNNLLTRAYLIPSLQKNVMMFYSYTINDSDTPENISYRYYNDMYRYWIVLYSNGILDPQGEWPLNSAQFQIYIDDKYGSASANANTSVLAYTKTTIHHYEKTISTKDSSSLQEQVVTIQIDEPTYMSLVPSSTSATLPSGVVVTKSIDKNAISIYDYEQKQNESKRNIQLMRDVYASSAERQLKALMSS